MKGIHSIYLLFFFLFLTRPLVEKLCNHAIISYRPCVSVCLWTFPVASYADVLRGSSRVPASVRGQERVTNPKELCVGSYPSGGIVLTSTPSYVTGRIWRFTSKAPPPRGTSPYSLATVESAINQFGLILGVKTCEVFLCFLAIVFLGSIVLTSQWLLCIHCFTSLVSFTGFYTEVNPQLAIRRRKGQRVILYSQTREIHYAHTTQGSFFGQEKFAREIFPSHTLLQFTLSKAVFLSVTFDRCI